VNTAPRTGRVEHAEPDEAPVERLVSRAAAGDDADLVRDRCVGPDDQLVLEVDAHQPGMGGGDAGECLGDHVLGSLTIFLTAGALTLMCLSPILV